MTENEMVAWHHPLTVHGFERTLGDSEGQGSLCAAIHGVAKRHNLVTEQQRVKENL